MAIFDSIPSLVTMEMGREQIPALSIGVLHRGETIWVHAQGIADVENAVPATEVSVYRTASLAKPITGVAAMRLVEAGALDLDAPVQRYVTEFPQKPWPITMRQLLGHVAGIRGYKDDAETYNTTHYWSLADVVRTFAADPLVSEPGTKYLYSTLGYVLAGRVIEGASGMSYIDYLKRHVFAPAGMPATGADDVYAIIPHRARGYSKASDGAVHNAALLDTSSKIPGGGLVSTAADLIRFMRAVDNGKLLTAKSVSEMFTSLLTTDGKRTSYGLGWGLDRFQAHPMLVHTGGQAGVATLLRYFNESHAGVVILCNMEQANIGRLADAVCELLLP